MDAVQRLKLIRARLRGTTSLVKATPLGLHCAATGLPPAPRKRMGMGKLDSDKVRAYGVADLGYAKNVNSKSEWLMIPVKKKPKHCAVKRTKKVSPLTKIAEAWDDPETFRPRPLKASAMG